MAVFSTIYVKAVKTVSTVPQNLSLEQMKNVDKGK